MDKINHLKFQNIYSICITLQNVHERQSILSSKHDNKVQENTLQE